MLLEEHANGCGVALHHGIGETGLRGCDRRTRYKEEAKSTKQST
jgi:hypothetical protein